MAQTIGEDAALTTAEIPSCHLRVYRPSWPDKFLPFALDPFAGQIFLAGLSDLFGHNLRDQ